MNYSTIYFTNIPFCKASHGGKNSIINVSGVCLSSKKVVLKFFFIFLSLFPQEFFSGPNFKVQAFFSPGGQVTQELIKRISNVKKTLFAAVYTFTDASIAQALVDAKKRGVDVQVIVDRGTIESPWGKVGILVDEGVSVYCKLSDKALSQAKGVELEVIDDVLEVSTQEVSFPRALNLNFGPIMHHKYAILDGCTVWTGSFNWTLSANNKNNENVVVIDGETDLANKFTNNFKTVLTSCKKIDKTLLEAMVKNSKEQKQLWLDKRAFMGTSLSVGLPKKKNSNSTRVAMRKIKKPKSAIKKIRPKSKASVIYA